ncbi:MAG TPA: Fe2+-dependent dioxygenase [Allosphingosinicella sp.]|nr:Fe2+-dependent dioxygenase [Allosphingosinicella sp.]
MMLAIPDLLDKDGVARVREIVDGGPWADGNSTSGPQSALAKRNQQLPEDSAAARSAGSLVLEALGRSPSFIAAALPLKIFPPLFNRYRGGEAFGTHIDNAIRIHRASEYRVRTDLSATLFLEAPDAYEGGELVVEDDLGAQPVKLPAGHLLLYPASSLHRVEPVTQGARVASFFWVQSMVRDGGARSILFDLDRSIQGIAAERGQEDREVIRLTGVYHNLLRRWADS